MRRVAVIADIHANLPALVAGLRAVDVLDVDSVYGAGDLVGYGPHPVGVCRLVQARAIATVYGNRDYAIGRNLDDPGIAYTTKHDRDLARRSVAWTLAHTDQQTKDYLRALPFDLRFDRGSARVRLVHGSPRRVSEKLLEQRPARRFERIAAEADCDVLVFGHTHKPWIREHAGVLFVNCGAIGKPEDGDPRPAFALLEIGTAGRVRASIQRVPHDTRAIAQEIDATRMQRDER